MEARARLSPYQYWSKVRRQRKKSKLVRAKERARFVEKLEWIIDSKGKCERHLLCKWMRRHEDEWRKKGETIGCETA